MPQNIEIKAEVDNFISLLRRAKELSHEEGNVLQQKDIFYHCQNGRLKLRYVKQENSSRSELIYYQRGDEVGPKLSDYVITPVQDFDGMDRVLEASFGRRGIVSKQRILFMVGQTRVHVDKVEGLGDYMELEVVMRKDQSPEDGVIVAHTLMEKLGINPCSLVTGAYFDLLAAKQARN